jgi:hypothetical protein
LAEGENGGLGYRKAEKWEDDGEAGRVELREEGDLSDWREKKPKIQKPKAGFLWFSLKGGGNGLSVDEFRYRFLCVFYFCKIAPFLCVSCKLLFIGEVWHGHKHIVLSIFIFFVIFWILNFFFLKPININVYSIKKLIILKITC